MDLTLFNSPPLTVAANIALDKLLLNAVNNSEFQPSLRFYNPSNEALVVGLAQDHHQTINISKAQQLNIPILKRFSGGGTVLVSANSLTFSAIINHTPEVPRYAVNKAYNYLFNPLRAIFNKYSLKVDFFPPCDLAIGGKKIAGTAQAQKRHCLMIHGCILINQDLTKIEALLPHPPAEPHYRLGRPHSSFLANLAEFDLQEEQVKEILIQAWTNSNPALEISNQYIQEAQSISPQFVVN